MEIINVQVVDITHILKHIKCSCPRVYVHFMTTNAQQWASKSQQQTQNVLPNFHALIALQDISAVYVLMYQCSDITICLLISKAGPLEYISTNLIHYMYFNDWMLYGHKSVFNVWHASLSSINIFIHMVIERICWRSTNNILHIYRWGCVVAQHVYHALMTSSMTSLRQTVCQTLN